MQKHYVYTPQHATHRTGSQLRSSNLMFTMVISFYTLPRQSQDQLVHWHFLKFVQNSCGPLLGEWRRTLAVQDGRAGFGSVQSLRHHKTSQLSSGIVVGIVPVSRDRGTAKQWRTLLHSVSWKSHLPFAITVASRSSMLDKESVSHTARQLKQR